MAHDGSVIPPTLTTWAEVDPARYPFGPDEVPALIRAVGDAVGQSDLRGWRDSVSAVLSDRYGPWAYYWYWAPDAWREWDWIIRFPPPAEALTHAADSLFIWRRWLERIAEQFDLLLPLLAPAQAGSPRDLVAGWEAGIAGVMRMAVAPTVDNDGWQGWCCRALRWFLTAAGVPVEHAEALVNSAVDGRFDYWVPLTEADVVNVAEQLTRGVLNLGGIAPAASADSWPDTWPQNWPAWRATNTTDLP